MAARDKSVVSADIKHAVGRVILYAFQSRHVGRIQLLKPIRNAAFGVSKLYQPVDGRIRNKKRAIASVTRPCNGNRSAGGIRAFDQPGASIVHKLIAECREYGVAHRRNKVNRGTADKTYALAKRHFHLLINLKRLSVVV